jgi:hypothetical protein
LGGAILAPPAHQHQDERIRTAWFFEGLEFCYRLLKQLARTTTSP